MKNETKNQFMTNEANHCKKCWHINIAHPTSRDYCKDENCLCHLITEYEK